MSLDRYAKATRLRVNKNKPSRETALPRRILHPEGGVMQLDRASRRLGKRSDLEQSHPFRYLTGALNKDTSGPTSSLETGREGPFFKVEKNS